MKASHAFNLLDARGAISVTERQKYIGRIRGLARGIASAYLAKRRDGLPARATPPRGPRRGGGLTETGSARERGVTGRPQHHRFAARKVSEDGQELIFEIGCEEMPAGSWRRRSSSSSARSRAVRRGASRLRGARTVGTPRRIVLLVEQVAERQKDLREERTGPPAKIAFDEDGQPTRAAQGFARGQGVDVEDLYTVETDKGEYLACEVFEPGRPAAELMPQILQGALEALEFPQSMRWASWSARFARPVRWIVALLGDQVLELEFAGVTSGQTTRGHRFSAPEPIEVESIEQYIDALTAADVVVDPAPTRDDRGAARRLRPSAPAARSSMTPSCSTRSSTWWRPPRGARGVRRGLPGAARRGAHLVDAQPPALLQRGRPGHRRAAQRLRGHLQHAGRDPSVVRAGNLRVLQARLDDARFFWEQDLKQPLAERVERLGMSSGSARSARSERSSASASWPRGWPACSGWRARSTPPAAPATWPRPTRSP